MKNMNSFILEEQVGASAAEVWDLIYNRFGEAYLYNVNLTGSHYIHGQQGALNCKRHCSLERNTFVEEQIIEVDEGQSFRLKITNTNFPMIKEMYATYHVINQAEDQTMVRMILYYSTSPGFMALLMKSMMKKLLKKNLIGLKFYLEVGRTVDKKNFKLIHKEYRQLAPGQSFANAMHAA